MSELHVTDHDAVRTLTLDGPASRNGLAVELCDQLIAAITSAPGRVLVLTGAGGAFSSGLDLKQALQRGLAAGPELEAGLRRSFHGVIRALVASPCPTIAAVDGAAVGFGCDLALACDLRVVSDRATFGEIFVRRGLMPDGGSTYHLPRIIGLGRALELMYTGDLVAADEALRIGLANRVVPAAELAVRVAELAARIAAGPPLAYARIKRAVHASLDGDLEAALDREATGQMELLASEDFSEGVSAFLQKRAPAFRGS